MQSDQLYMLLLIIKSGRKVGPKEMTAAYCYWIGNVLEVVFPWCSSTSLAIGNYTTRGFCGLLVQWTSFIGWSHITGRCGFCVVGYCHLALRMPRPFIATCSHQFKWQWWIKFSDMNLSQHRRPDSLLFKLHASMSFGINKQLVLCWLNYGTWYRCVARKFHRVWHVWKSIQLSFMRKFWLWFMQYMMVFCSIKAECYMIKDH